MQSDGGIFSVERWGFDNNTGRWKTCNYDDQIQQVVRVSPLHQLGERLQTTWQAADDLKAPVEAIHIDEAQNRQSDNSAFDHVLFPIWYSDLIVLAYVARSQRTACICIQSTVVQLQNTDCQE